MAGLLLRVVMIGQAAASLGRVRVDSSRHVARFEAANLTAVAIDTCALKQSLNLSNPMLLKLSANLGPGILRVGGTDQNVWSYDMNDQRASAFGCPCGNAVSAGCVMTAPYWESLLEFAASTGFRLLFGLAPGEKPGKSGKQTGCEAVSNASALMNHTASLSTRLRTAVLGYTFGNEQLDAADAKGFAEEYRVRLENLRASAPEGFGMLVAPDVGVGPRQPGITPTRLADDETIAQHLEYLRVFANINGHLLDAISWHTYDFRSTDLASTDHQPLPWPPTDANFSRFWSSRYLGVFETLSDRVAAAVVGDDDGDHIPVWLTEENSINHQGIFNLTDAFGNTLWLAHRLGVAAQRGVALVARQSLIGSNYSLLGDFPREPIVPAPDYFATALFRHLVQGASLQATLELDAPGARDANDGGDAPARAFAYCGVGGGVVVSLHSLHETETLEVIIAGLDGRRLDYVLAPHWPSDDRAPARFKLTARQIELNGVVLETSPEGDLPDFPPREALHADEPVALAPLTFAYYAFPDHQAEACRDL